MQGNVCAVVDTACQLALAGSFAAADVSLDDAVSVVAGFAGSVDVPLDAGVDDEPA